MAFIIHKNISGANALILHIVIEIAVRGFEQDHTSQVELFEV